MTLKKYFNNINNSKELFLLVKIFIIKLGDKYEKNNTSRWK